MPIFSADALYFLITDLFLEEGIIHFSSNLNTGADLAINFDLVKCITKINIPKLYWKDAERAFTKKIKYISKMCFHGVFKGD